MEDSNVEAMEHLKDTAAVEEEATNKEVVSEAQEDSVEDIKVAMDMEVVKVEAMEAVVVLVATRPGVVALEVEIEAEAKVAHLSETTTIQSLSATSEKPINVMLRISSEVST